MVRELGWARRPEDHLHDPDDETVAADQRDAQDGKQKHDQEDEQAGLVPLGRGDRGRVSFGVTVIVLPTGI